MRALICKNVRLLDCFNSFRLDDVFHVGKLVKFGWVGCFFVSRKPENATLIIQHMEQGP